MGTHHGETSVTDYGERTFAKFTDIHSRSTSYQLWYQL